MKHATLTQPASQVLHCASCAELVEIADDGRCYGCDTILDADAYRRWFWTDAPEAFARPVVTVDFTKGVL